MENGIVNISVNWLVGPSNPPMNFGFLMDSRPRLVWRTYQPEARHFHLCKAPQRRHRQPLDSVESLQASGDRRCLPPLRPLLLSKSKPSAACALTVRAVSPRLALAECRRRLEPGSTALLVGRRVDFAKPFASFRGNQLARRRRLRTFFCGVEASLPRSAARCQAGCVRCLLASLVILAFLLGF